METTTRRSLLAASAASAALAGVTSLFARSQPVLASADSVPDSEAGDMNGGMVATTSETTGSTIAAGNAQHHDSRRAAPISAEIGPARIQHAPRGIAMTHRNALIFSLVVTLLLSAGVLIGRDRLFAAETVVDQPASIPVSQSPGSVQRASLAETGPRIVDVPLPSSLGSGSERAKARQGDDERVPARESESGNDHDWDEEEHDDD